MESEFTFPDSGITIKIERVSQLMTSMVMSNLQANYPGKHVPPAKEVRSNTGELVQTVDMPLDPQWYREELAKTNLREEVRAGFERDLEIVNTYLKEKKEWEKKAGNAYEYKMRLLYAKQLRTQPEQKEIIHLTQTAREMGVDIRQAVLDEYKDAGVEFDPALMDAWIYLWMVCAKSAADTSIFRSWMQTGSREALQATRQALNLF